MSEVWDEPTATHSQKSKRHAKYMHLQMTYNAIGGHVPMPSAAEHRYGGHAGQKPEYGDIKKNTHCRYTRVSRETPGGVGPNIFLLSAGIGPVYFESEMFHLVCQAQEAWCCF